MRFGYLEGVTQGRCDKGTITLLAALNLLDCPVLARKPRGRHREFLAFLNELTRNVPAEFDIHLIADNATDKYPKVKAWLDHHPRCHLHYTPTYTSWLKQLERWLSLLAPQCVGRGSSHSAREPIRKIDAYVTCYDAHKHPFCWIATANSIVREHQRQCKVTNGTVYSSYSLDFDHGHSL